MLSDTTFNSAQTSADGVPHLDDEMFEITTDARRDVSDLVDRSQGSKNLMELPAGPDESKIGDTHYDDFHTIDWLKDLSRDRFRHRILQKRKKDIFINSKYDKIMNGRKNINEKN